MQKLTPLPGCLQIRLLWHCLYRRSHVFKRRADIGSPRKPQTEMRKSYRKTFPEPGIDFSKVEKQRGLLAV